MKTARKNLRINQGATFRESFEWRAASVQVNLTGWKARMQIRPDHESNTVISELTTENDGITIRPLSGGFDLYISAEETAEFKFEDAVYDIELVDEAGDVTRVVEGRVRLSPEVTR